MREIVQLKITYKDYKMKTKLFRTKFNKIHIIKTKIKLIQLLQLMELRHKQKKEIETYQLPKLPNQLLKINYQMQIEQSDII